jgi:hypothetical protein
MRNTAFKYGSLFIGLLAAAIIIFSQSFSPQLRSNEKNPVESKTGETNSDATDVLIPSISATSFPASAQINFFQDAFCLFEVIFSNDISYPEIESPDLSLSKFYNTILEVIISPNAP